MAELSHRLFPASAVDADVGVHVAGDHDHVGLRWEVQDVLQAIIELIFGCIGVRFSQRVDCNYV